MYLFTYDFIYWFLYISNHFHLFLFIFFFPQPFISTFTFSRILLRCFQLLSTFIFLLYLLSSLFIYFYFYLVCLLFLIHVKIGFTFLFLFILISPPDYFFLPYSIFLWIIAYFSSFLLHTKKIILPVGLCNCFSNIWPSCFCAYFGCGACLMAQGRYY